MAVESGPPASEKHAKAIKLMEEMTRNADLVQEKVLAEILSRKAETEYLRGFKLCGETDRETFKSKLPVMRYEDLQSEIQRIANGDRSPILSAHPIFEFHTSSGTSAGERKLMPTIRGELDRLQLLDSLLMPDGNLYVPGMDKGKVPFFLSVLSETKTPGGLLARPFLTSYYKGEHFKTRPIDPYNFYTSPNEAILCPDFFQSMYTQMLCGFLEPKQVLRVGPVFASGLLQAIQFLQHNWAQITHDIRTGTLNPNVTDPNIRDCMAGRLKSDPDLADFIAAQCSNDNWDGISTRIWPNTKYLDVIVTGAMALSIPILDYYSGGLPLACTMYTSSECYFGLNLNPLCKPSEASYTIMPNMACLEFLLHDPKSTGSASGLLPSKLVDFANVEVRKEYELAITTYMCPYQCRVQQNQQSIGERMIYEVFAKGDESSLAKKKYALEVTIGREVLTIDRPNKKARVEQLSITFTEEEANEVFQSRNDPLVISSIIMNCKIRKILVDTGSSVDILYLEAFENIKIEKDKLQADKSSLVGFAGNQITPLGSIVLPITLGEEPHQATEMVKFLVVDYPSNYNAILGRPSLNKFKAIPSTYHMRIKFPTLNGVGCVKSD